MRSTAFCALLLVGSAFAGSAAAAPDDGDLLAHLPPDARIESRVDADLTADGREDVAFVGCHDEQGCELVVLGARADGSYGVLGRESFGFGGLGPPSVSATRKGVLVLEDLVGGTTATQGTYRYRWDPERGALRLIGLDARHYSRTFGHDAFDISWNLLTGAFIAQRHVLTDGGDAAYAPQPQERTVRRSVPVWLGDTPDAEGIIEAELAERAARESEDRD